MAKFGKFLLSTAALVGTAATAYYIYKNVKIKVDVDVEEDEDLDDFSEEEETEETTYVTLNPEASPVEEMAEAVAEKTAEVVEEVKEQAAEVIDEVKEAVTNIAEDFSGLAEQVSAEESVEEFFNDED